MGNVSLCHLVYLLTKAQNARGNKSHINQDHNQRYESGKYKACDICDIVIKIFGKFGYRGKRRSVRKVKRIKIVFLGVFEQIFPNFQSLTQDPILDVLCYILIVGVAMAILFSHNASSGGMDIVAKILHKYLKMELGKAVSISGMAVALTSALCYDTKTVILSVLGTYFSGLFVDHFIFGFNIKRRVCVISPKLDEIVEYILHDLHSGATLNEITGAYQNVKKQEVITIVDKNEYRKLMDFIRKTDPNAFVTVYSVNEIRYQPKIKNT
jgi:uncharacterized membrane-anchored protein YitT (DUF2179 family)